MNDRPIEVSEEVAAALKATDAELSSLNDRLIEANAARQKIIDDAIAGAVELQIGQDVVDARGRTFRVTRIRGEYHDYNFHGVSPKIWIRYEGRQVKKDGTLRDRAANLYNVTPKRD